MESTRRQTGAPAHSEHNRTSNADPAFEWYASYYNVEFAKLAQLESADRYTVHQDMPGLDCSPMYRVLEASFRKALREARTERDRRDVLLTFAARCYRVGFMAGTRG